MRHTTVTRDTQNTLTRTEALSHTDTQTHTPHIVTRIQQSKTGTIVLLIIVQTWMELLRL